MALAIVGFACWCLLILGPTSLPGRGLDFRIFYTAASLPLDDLYNLDRQVAFQEELWNQYGRYIPSPFPRPAFYAFLLKPLTLFRYPVALHLWLAALCAIVVGAALLIRKLYGIGFGIFFLLVGYYPVSVALRNGQDSPLVLAVLLLAVHFHRRGREWLAALCLAFAFEKFNLVFLAPVALLLHGKKSWFIKLCVAGVAFAGWSLALVGISGLRDYGRMLSRGSLDALFYDAWNVRTVVWNLGWNQALYVTLTAATLIWFAWLCRRIEFETAFWLAAAFSPLISWNSYFYLLWAKHRVYLAALFLGSGLRAHFFLMERVSWLITLLVLAMSVQFWWRSRPSPAATRLAHRERTAGEPWSRKEGPMEAVDDFLRDHPNFQPDASREKYGATFNPKGWLKRFR